MKKLLKGEKRTEILIGLVVIICLLLSSDVFAFMPSSIVMLALTLFVAAFSLFAVVIWRENPRDEREAHVQMVSDRLGFLAGSITLSIGLVIAGLRHQSTDLLALALTGMVLGKILGKYLQK